MRKLVERGLGTGSKEVNLAGRREWYFCLSMIVLILSACFPAIEKQLITLALIIGIKWVANGSVGKINIIIKQGGDYGSKI
jgi:hypothetical protein